MRRLKRQPRNRKYKPEFDWRDPDMPVLRRVESRGLIRVMPIKAEDEQAERQLSLNTSVDPRFDKDPTYALKIYKPKTYLRKLRKGEQKWK
jgi:hypothetical protein